MQIISFRNAALFKRGILLSAVSVLACVAAPSAVDGSLFREPIPSVGALCMLSAFFVYLLLKTQVHRLADEVIDCGDYLEVRRGNIREHVVLANIAAVNVSGSGLHRITLRLVKPIKLGAQIDFLPQAGLWSNPQAIHRLALHLNDRAAQARAR
jgi:hypothetical protein